MCTQEKDTQSEVCVFTLVLLLFGVFDSYLVLIYIHCQSYVC